MHKSDPPISSVRAATGVQAPFECVAVAGTQLAVARRGAGQPVLCLHATAHGGRDYEGLVSALVPAGFEVVCVDWPGHGASPEDETGQPASAKRYANILQGLIPALFQDQKPILIGNSIGGAAALITSLEDPEAVRALILCNPGGLAPLDGLATCVIRLLVRFFEAGAKGARWFPAAFGLYYHLILSGQTAAAQRARIIAAGREMAPILSQAWRSFGEAEADLSGRVGMLHPPVLFAWAKSDQIVAWSRSKPAVESIPHAKVKFFNGSHAAFLEDPTAFQNSFLEFLQELSLTPSKS